MAGKAEDEAKRLEEIVKKQSGLVNGKMIEEMEEKARVNCVYGPDANNEYMESKLTAMEYTLICEAKAGFCTCDFENSGFRVISGDIEEF